MQRELKSGLQMVHVCHVSEQTRTHTAWSDWPHQSVHLDIPVFDVGARLPKFPLGGLAEKKSLAVTDKQVN